MPLRAFALMLKIYIENNLINDFATVTIAVQLLVLREKINKFFANSA